jgi:hypothetical protein
MHYIWMLKSDKSLLGFFKYSNLTVWMGDYVITGLGGWVQKMTIFAYYQYIEGGWLGQKKSKNMFM